MCSINYISRLYCYNPKASNTPISISFDYRKMKTVESLIRNLARNPENHTCEMPGREPLWQNSAWTHCSAILQRILGLSNRQLGHVYSHFQQSTLIGIGACHSFPQRFLDQFNQKVCVHAILVLSDIFKTTRILFVFD